MTKTRILTLVDRRYRAQAQPRGMVAALRGLGADVVVLDDAQVAETNWHDALNTADVAVARGRKPQTLAALEYVQHAGLPVVDSAAAVEGVRDKRLMTRTLIESGVPTPRTVIGSLGQIACSGLTFPLILKPIFGDNSAGLAIVETQAELSCLPWPEPEALAQEYHPNQGVDLKLYVIDGSITAVRKPSPITPCVSGLLGRTELNPELRDLAHRCGEAFGLKFYGVDCLELDSGVEVLEVNEFPNYSSVPYASELLALQVLRRAAA